MREILKEWINRWEKLCKTEQYIRVHETFWNSPEGCVSIIHDFAANGSLANLLNSVGALPESILKQLAKQVLRAIDRIHQEGLTHSSISCSQIVFDRRGKVRLSPGFGHIIKSKSETTSTLDQHYSVV
jgi:serine/threonine protein kinase